MTGSASAFRLPADLRGLPGMPALEAALQRLDATLDALRAWPADRQVGLLFVVLFGTLALASTGLLLWGLWRQRGDEGSGPGSVDTARRQRREARIGRLQADLRAVWIGALLFWLAWVSGPAGATLLFGVLSFLALRELVTLLRTRRGDHRSLILAFFAVLPLQYLLVGLRSFDLFSVLIPVYTFLAIPVVSALAGDPERFIERNAGIQWGLTVTVYGLSHAPALLLLDLPAAGGRLQQGRGAFLLFFLVMVVAAAQIAQELAGRRRSGRPLARRIDRSFSGRGFVIGLAAALGVGLLLSWTTPFGPLRALPLALLAGAAGQAGELVMSALKRDAGVSGWAGAPGVTGAVGLLDRLAPLCFAAPVFFHAVRWYLPPVRG